MRQSLEELTCGRLVGVMDDSNEMVQASEGLVTMLGTAPY